MRVLELFAGTQSFSKVAREYGHWAYTTDIDPQFTCDFTGDIMDFDPKWLFLPVDVIWASPPCETFSVASIGHHWKGGACAYEPKTQASHDGIARVERTLEIIKELNPKFWIIENPRGLLRKMPFWTEATRYTVTYCQYGDTRMKPTDLWSNVPDLVFKPMCKNGMPCHESAPRGAKTGTQGIKGYRDRSRVPAELCESIIEQLENKDCKGGNDD